MQIANITGLTDAEKSEYFTLAAAMSEAEQLVYISAFRSSVLIEELDFRLGEADERNRKFKELYEDMSNGRF